MATVLAMKFNENQAILVSDESTWHLGAVLGYRRTNYGDSLASLVEPEQTRKSGTCAVYGGVGFPSFHYEVARRSRRLLSQGDGRDARDAASIGRLVASAYISTHERLIDDKLEFNFGFGRDALNSRSYKRDGRKLEIGQDVLVDSARSMAAGNARGNAYARIFHNEGLVVAHDKSRGVQGWYLDSRGAHLDFTTSLATLGEGAEVATHLVARHVQRRDLDLRRRGFGLTDGLYIAMSIATEIRLSVGKMGGYFQILFVDGARGVRELVSDAAHLTGEVMRAHLWGFLSRADAQEFLTALIVDGADDLAVEKELFRRASDSDKLRRYLMGFKPVQAPSALANDLPGSPVSAGAPARDRSIGRGQSVLEAVAATKAVTAVAAVAPTAREARQRGAGRTAVRKGGDPR